MILARRVFVVSVTLLALCFGLASCQQDAERALVLVDASPEAAAAGLETRLTAFERQSGRAVRLLRVPTAEAALELAARGDADVAIVPAGAKLDGFVAPAHGRVVGRASPGGVELQVLEVNAAQHPKVDAAGARLLAEAVRDR